MSSLLKLVKRDGITSFMDFMWYILKSLFVLVLLVAMFSNNVFRNVIGVQPSLIMFIFYGVS